MPRPFRQSPGAGPHPGPVIAVVVLTVLLGPALPSLRAAGTQTLLVIDVYVYDMASSELERISSCEGYYPLCSIYGTSVVWSGSRGVYNCSSHSLEMTYLDVGYNPKISSDRIVWTEKMYGYPENALVVHNVSSGGTYEHPLPAGQILLCYDVHDDTAVYISSDTGGHTMYLVSVDLLHGTNNTVLYMESDSSRIGTGGVSIFGDTVVFNSDHDGLWCIYEYDLSSGSLSTLWSGPEARSEGLMANGRYVLWCPPDPNGTVHLYDRANSTHTSLSRLLGGGGYPARACALYGDKVAAVLDTDRGCDIVLLNISAGRTSVIASSLPLDIERIRLYGDILVLESVRHSEGSFDPGKIADRFGEICLLTSGITSVAVLMAIPLYSRYGKN